MALYGGQIEPKIALGGFPVPVDGIPYKILSKVSDSHRKIFFEGEPPNYRLATGIILTFLVNNSVDKSELEPALEWEQK